MECFHSKHTQQKRLNIMTSIDDIFVKFMLEKINQNKEKDLLVFGLHGSQLKIVLVRTSFLQNFTYSSNVNFLNNLFYLNWGEKEFYPFCDIEDNVIGLGSKKEYNTQPFFFDGYNALLTTIPYTDIIREFCKLKLFKKFIFYTD